MLTVCACTLGGGNSIIPRAFWICSFKPVSSLAILLMVSVNFSPKRTVPPGKCHFPLLGSISLFDKTTPFLVLITKSTHSFGTLLYIDRNSLKGSFLGIFFMYVKSTLLEIGKEKNSVY